MEETDSEVGEEREPAARRQNTHSDMIQSFFPLIREDASQRTSVSAPEKGGQLCTTAVNDLLLNE